MNQNRLNVYEKVIDYNLWCTALTATYDETAAPKFIEDLIEKVKTNPAFEVVEHFLGDIKQFVTDVSNHTKLGVQEIALALSHKDIYALFKAIGFNLAKLLKAVVEATRLLKTTFITVFEVILKSGLLDEIKAGAASIDEVLARYPNLKKIAGPALAGILFIVWMNSSFTGHPDIDLDMSDIVNALHGTYSIEDMFLSATGLASLALLCANFATGGSLSMCNWLGSNSYNLILAIVYTGILKNPKLKPLVAQVKAKLPMSKFKVDNHAMKLAGA